MSAELLRPELVKRCQATSSVTLDGQSVDLRKACQVLSARDGRYEVDIVGPVLWREFITRYEPAELQRSGALFAQGFNPADPVNTPNTLAADQDGSRQSLTTLEPHKIPERVKGSRFLGKDGYLINRGSSFVMALEYTAQGPRAQAFLTCSQLGDPTSPLFYDQTQLFSAKKWRRILFTEAEIKADPNLQTIRVTSGK
ncbi:MAG TPA: penicillin acylase family protein [Blastocatellia bacterium]|nr:penicillin acylase family protein [Blastocatellia bacterium]